MTSTGAQIGPPDARAESSSGAISPDGRFVAFTDTYPFNAYLRDLVDRTTERIDVASNAEAQGARVGTVSHGGLVVGFASYRVPPLDEDPLSDAFVNVANAR